MKGERGKVKGESGDGGKIREELKRIVPEYDFTTETQRTRRKDKKIM